MLNRTAALAAVKRELGRAQRSGAAVLLLFIDLDGLKEINDTYGHAAGDEAIRLAAQALRAESRATDVVARLGGDEFLVAGTCNETRGDLPSLARRIHRAVAHQSLSIDGITMPLRCSIGVAMSNPGDEVESLIHEADQALYEAKRRGRNQVFWRNIPTIPAPRASAAPIAAG